MVLRGHDVRRAVSALVAIALASCSRSEKVDDPYRGAALGALTFHVTEGNQLARIHFARGLLALHSFWYDEAARQFTAATAADPSMNLAYWGLAMANVQLLWGDDNLSAAKQALARMPDPERLSPREQAWVFATIDLLKAPDVRASRVAYVRALERLHAEHPDDETATFLAVALLSTIRPEDPDNTAVRERAAKLAAEVLARNPNHPGAAHYLIHAYDTPALAPRALAAATAYPKIAPTAFHAQHMPAHIFTRLGMWREAIASCRTAWDASRSAAKRAKLTANAHDYHSLSWLVDLPFERGRRKEADAALKQFADAVRGGLARKHRALYAEAVASYLVRTGELARVDELLAPLEAPAVEAPTPSDGLCGVVSPDPLGERVAVLETRAIAAAYQHDHVKTAQLLGELDAARAELAPVMAKTQPAQVITALAASHARERAVLLARAANDDRALVAALREMAAAAHVETGGENNPSAFVASEQLGDALLRLGDAAAAADAYARALAQHPKRAHSLLGAARAARARGDAAAARRFYGELLAVWADAEPSTPGLSEARDAVN